jgi:hypothetical protein
MADKKKVVNTEEQNRAVNPGDRSYEKQTETTETDKKGDAVNTSSDEENPAEPENPESIEENT